MTSDSYVKQISSSWGLTPNVVDQTADNSFLQLQTQGQSFFNVSGDDDAIINGEYSGPGGSDYVYSFFDFPSEDPYITQVGGTTLTTTGPAGSYVSEKVWNTGAYNSNREAFVGSSGGAAYYYSIPSYQQGVNMSNNDGSTTARDVPDVALTADSIYEWVDNQPIYDQGGTSCAAPLWAGFTAMGNQQAASLGHSYAGFLNPALYSIGEGGNYNAYFHDVTSGDNAWPGSGGRFPAVTGYDLSTGWGTPQCQALINYLSGAVLAATINGPTYLPANQPGGYSALATGGAPPYSYQWWKLEETTAAPASPSASPNIPPGNTWFEIGTNSPTVSTSDTYNFEIKCVVSDATGNNVTSNVISVEIGAAGNALASNHGTDTGVDQVIPKTNSLSQNYPNPFNPTTQIRFGLSKPAHVKLVVYDVLGREVAVLANHDMGAGYHTVTWAAENLPSGVYIYRLTAGSFVQIKRMLFLK